MSKVVPMTKRYGLDAIIAVGRAYHAIRKQGTPYPKDLMQAIYSRLNGSQRQAVKTRTGVRRIVQSLRSLNNSKRPNSRLIQFPEVAALLPFTPIIAGRSSRARSSGKRYPKATLTSAEHHIPTVVATVDASNAPDVKVLMERNGDKVELDITCDPVTANRVLAVIDEAR